VATAETAKLIAALELQDKFSKPLGKAEGAIGGFEKRLSGMQRNAALAGQGVNRGLTNLAKIGVVGAVAGVGLLVVNVKKGVDALNELENVTVATQTVLKSTNGISGQTAEGIREMSEEYENLNATIDDKVIQSGANLLLTFTNIRDKAFEPTLEAALNMNEALGGGPEGLQGIVTTLGRALNDPAKGLSRLEKRGATFTDQQKEEIKALQESGDMLGAQEIILDRLADLYGGRFAAAGDTAAGKQAALADRIEDVQKALAGPLLPAIDRVRDKLIDFLGSDRVLQGAEQLGESIAGLFTDANLERGVALLEQGMDALTSGDFSGISADIGGIASTVGGLPWESIGNAARLLGTGSKALLDAFMGLPPWVQTAVLTGWGLNKLTGGALGGILGGVTTGLGKWITQKLGLMTVQAGVVNVNGPTGGPGGGKGPASKLPLVAGLAALPLMLSGSTNNNAQMEADRLKVKSGEMTRSEFDRLWNHGAVAQSLKRVESLTRDERSAILTSVDATRGVSGAVGGLGPRIDAVARTPHNVDVRNNVNVNNTVGVSVIANQMYRSTVLRTSTGFSESTNSAGI